MYLSIVQPDFSRVNVARALINEQDMHRNIQAMFNLDRQTANVLYRTIPSKDMRRSVICVQSNAIPKSTEDIKVITCVNADERVAKVKDNMIIAFDVLLRPAKRHEGKSALIREKDARMDWVKALGTKYGFTVRTVHELSQIKKSIHHTGTRAGRIDGWRYTGTLIVDHAETFKKAYITGIGRDKSYGFGMLMLKI